MLFLEPVSHPRLWRQNWVVFWAKTVARIRFRGAGGETVHLVRLFCWTVSRSGLWRRNFASRSAILVARTAAQFRYRSFEAERPRNRSKRTNTRIHSGIHTCMHHVWCPPRRYRPISKVYFVGFFSVVFRDIFSNFAMFSSSATTPPWEHLCQGAKVLSSSVSKPSQNPEIVQHSD